MKLNEWFQIVSDLSVLERRNYLSMPDFLLAGFLKSANDQPILETSRMEPLRKRFMKVLVFWVLPPPCKTLRVLFRGIL